MDQTMLGIGAPVFQFYADLLPSVTNHEILHVTDAQTVLSYDRASDKWYLRTRQRVDEFDAANALRLLTDSGFALVLDKQNPLRKWVVNTRTKTTVPLAHSPILDPRIEDVNEEGWIGGYVIAKQGSESVSYGRIWDRTGAENVTIGAPNSRIECVEPFGTTWSAGFVGQTPTLWRRNHGTALNAPVGSQVSLSNVAGNGVVAGTIDHQAAVWDSDGSLIYRGTNLGETSRTLSVMEDSSFLIEIGSEKSKTYRIGRGGQTAPFESSSLKSIEGFPIVSVDGISPAGVMVLTIVEPVSKQNTRVLVGPETFRSDSRIV